MGVTINQFGVSMLEGPSCSSFSTIIWLKKDAMDMSFPFWQIWKVKTQRIVVFFAWEVGWWYILTLDKLIKGRKIIGKWMFFNVKKRRSHVITSFYSACLCINCGPWRMGYWTLVGWWLVQWDLDVEGD